MTTKQYLDSIAEVYITDICGETHMMFYIPEHNLASWGAGYYWVPKSITKLWTLVFKGGI